MPTLKEIRSTMTFDRTTAEALRALAECRTEGNRSLLVRELVREEAARVAEQQAERQLLRKEGARPPDAPQGEAQGVNNDRA